MGSTLKPPPPLCRLSAQVRSCGAALVAAGFSAVSVMSKRGKLAPLRTVFYLDQGAMGREGAVGWAGMSWGERQEAGHGEEALGGARGHAPLARTAAGNTPSQ